MDIEMNEIDSNSVPLSVNNFNSVKNIKKSFYVLFGLLIIASIIFGVLSWKDIKNSEEQHLLSLVELSSNSSDSFLHQIDNNMLFLIKELGNSDDIISNLKFKKETVVKFKNANPELLNLSLIDQNGNLIISSVFSDIKEPYQIKNKDLFKVSLEDFKNGMIGDIGRPLYNKINNKWIMPIRYPIKDRVGNIVMILTAELALSAKQIILRPLNLPENAMLGMIRKDNFLILTNPQPPISNYKKFYNSSRDKDLIKYINKDGNQLESSITFGFSNLNDRYQIIAYKKLFHKQITLFISYPIKYVFEKWWKSTRITFLIIILLAISEIIIYKRTTKRQINWELQDIVSNKILIQSQARLEDALIIASVAHWEYDCFVKTVILSEQFLSLLKYDKNVIKEITMDIFISTYIIPEDGKLIKEEIENAIINGVNELEINNEIRMIRGDGGLSWYQFQIRTQKDNSGKVIKLSGAIQDITTRKSNEELLQLMAQVFQHNGLAIFICNEDIEIVASNKTFSEITGYNELEIIGKSPNILSTNEGSSSDYNAMWNEVNVKGFWRGELFSKCKSGKVYPQWLSISAVKNKDAKIINYIGSFSDMSDFKTIEEKVYHLAHHDSLTNLPNRLYLTNYLDNRISNIMNKECDLEKLAVMFIDLDRFKTINDTLGHDMGDLLLKEVARRLIAIVGNNGLVSRLGGDEFVIICDIKENIEDLLDMAKKIQEEIIIPYQINQHVLYTSPSIGISIYPDDANKVEDLMKNADMAMYHAKSLGRNNYQLYSTVLSEPELDYRLLEVSMHGAVDNNEFFLVYQPQIDTLTNKVTGVEALVRWNHPQRGVVSPVTFIPLAEETGIIIKLGEWVLKTACKQLREWQLLGLDITMSVNLSSLQFQQRDLVPMVERILKEYNIEGKYLELEITESVAMERPLESVGKMNDLNKLGVNLSIDDFGTGYSSLNYLKLYPISKLKIDRSFVKDIETDRHDAVICTATIVMAHSLGIKVVAEGVETKYQYNYLKNIQCDTIQGFLFSKPLLPNEIMSFVKTHEERDW
jgi:diguanylate cyclase (GGDEF)-like protein/PAS domain S-box-containing protein